MTQTLAFPESDCHLSIGRWLLARLECLHWEKFSLLSFLGWKFTFAPTRCWLRTYCDEKKDGKLIGLKFSSLGDYSCKFGKMFSFSLVRLSSERAEAVTCMINFVFSEHHLIMEILLFSLFFVFIRRLSSVNREALSAKLCFAFVLVNCA